MSKPIITLIEQKVFKFYGTNRKCRKFINLTYIKNIIAKNLIIKTKKTYTQVQKRRVGNSNKRSIIVSYLAHLFNNKLYPIC